MSNNTHTHTHTHTHTAQSFGQGWRPQRTAGWKGLLAGLVTGLALALQVTSVAAQQPLKIGLIGTNESQIPILVAIDQGYFKENGVTVETVNFKGGGVAVQAVAGGSIDLAAFATDHVIRLNSRGIDARFLLAIDRNITHLLAVPSGKGYKDLASLKGKKIGVSAPGSYSDNVLRWSLIKIGLNPDRDVTIVGVGSGNTSKAALKAGQIDALMISTAEAINFELNEPESYQILVDWRKTPHTGQALVGRQKWVDQNPELARGVVRAVLKAEQTIQANPAAVEAVVRKQYPDANDAFILAYSKAVPGLVSSDGLISDQSFDRMVDILRTIDPGLKTFKKSDLDISSQLR